MSAQSQPFTPLEAILFRMAARLRMQNKTQAVSFIDAKNRLVRRLKDGTVVVFNERLRSFSGNK